MKKVLHITVNKRVQFFTIIVLVIIFSSCKVISKQKNQRLLEQILFDDSKLESWIIRTEKQGKIYIDSVSRYRYTLFPDLPIGKQDSFYIPNCRYDNRDINIEIPENWGNIYSFFDGNVLEHLEKDSSTLMFLSPIMKAKEKNLYFIQVYAYQKTNLEGFWAWILFRQVRKFRIENQKIEELESEYLDADIVY